MMIYQKSCISMDSKVYDGIESTNWNCFVCDFTNCSSFSHHAHNLNATNSYDPLAGIPGDDSVFLYSAYCPNAVFEPHLHSRGTYGLKPNRPNLTNRLFFFAN